MALEWVFNLSITSKVDIFSYGIVVLEMVTGKCPSRSVSDVDDGGEADHKRLVMWVREMMNRMAANTSSLEEIIDPMLEGKYDMGKMEILVWVALQCVKEDKDERPTMSQVVDMLLPQEQDSMIVTKISWPTIYDISSGNLIFVLRQAYLILVNLLVNKLKSFHGI